MNPDIIVIGGGLAGMVAAYEASSHGADVCIIDESWSLGGQLRQQTQFLAGLPTPFEGLRGYECVERLDEQMRELPIRVLLGHTLIGTYSDGRIGAANDREVIPLSAASMIVATGAAETPIAFPGWTLPGVMTIGAIQIMINRERVYPGTRALVAGSSDFALQLVQQLLDVGVQVRGIIERSKSIVAKDPTIIQSFAKRKVPVFLNTRIEAAEGKGRVEKVKLVSFDTGQPLDEWEVDLIGIDGGMHPILEPFTALNCSLGHHSQLGGWVPFYNTDLHTSVNGVFVAGNAAGITHQAGIFITGLIAGLGAVASLGGMKAEEAKMRKQRLWKKLAEVESGPYQETWEARIEHMEQFLNRTIPRNPLKWKEVFT